MLVLIYGPSPLLWIADNYLPLATSSILLCIIYSLALYLASFRHSDVLLALGGNSGSHVYDFFIGRELNPCLGPLDLKFFCELRPGLIGWLVLNVSHCLIGIDGLSFSFL